MESLPDPLIVEADVLPPTWNPAHVREHAGRVISALCERPLWSSGELLTGVQPIFRDLRSDDEGRTWVAELATDSYWSDGTGIDAASCALALRHHFDGSSQHPLRRYLKSLGALVEANSGGSKSTLQIVLSRKVKSFSTLLAGHSLWAIHPKHWDTATARTRHISSGAYSLDSTLPRDRGVVLKRTDSFPRNAQTHHLPKTIIFYRTDDCSHGVNLFLNGSLHLTCNTWMNSATAKSLEQHADFHFGDLSIAATLQINPERLPSWSSVGCLNAVSAFIDREAIAAAQRPVLKPLWRLSDLWKAQICKPVLTAGSQEQPDAPTRPLKLIYARYSPNSEVVAAIAEALSEKCQVGIEPIGLDYLEFINRFGRGDFDIAYTLQTASFQHPLGIYARHLGRPQKSQADALLSAALLELEATSCGLQEDELSQRIHSAWMGRYADIPLFQVRGHYLSAHTSLQYEEAGLIKLRLANEQ